MTVDEAPPERWWFARNCKRERPRPVCDGDDDDATHELAVDCVEIINPASR